MFFSTGTNNNTGLFYVHLFHICQLRYTAKAHAGPNQLQNNVPRFFLAVVGVFQQVLFAG